MEEGWLAVEEVRSIHRRKKIGKKNVGEERTLEWWELVVDSQFCLV